MKYIDIRVNNINEELWLKFRAEVVRRKMRTGEALEEAISLWLSGE